MKTKNIFLTLALALSTTFAFAQSIVGSKHDMSALTWNAEGEICITCHTPHNSQAASVGAPLWNHAATATATFGLYASGTLDANVGQPAGTSKLCLSCHDGTVDLEAYGATASGAGTKMTGVAMLGTNLATHHPVSFTYDTALYTADGGATGGLFDPASKAEVADLLFGGSVECASCHDAHDTSNTKFLAVDNAASALCLTCHNK
jgi:predicted CXXCH cytochrome family protein